MARTTKPLTDTQIKHAKAKDKTYYLFDGEGLHLEVTPKGKKWWRFKYRLNGKPKKISFGVYPSVSLELARQKRSEAKEKIANGIDPSEERKKKKQELQQETKSNDNTFFTVSQKWLDSYKSEVSENYHGKLTRLIEKHLYRAYSDINIKDKDINDITRLEIIGILEYIKSKGLHETARRVAMVVNKIYKYAVTYEYARHNIVADIDRKTVLGEKKVVHYPTITKEKEIKGLLLSIDSYKGLHTVKNALKLMAYTFVRSHNILHMEWREIDFKNKVWTIPAEKMKTKEEFVLPLPDQAIKILEEVRQTATSVKYVFSGIRSDGKPLSDNTLISAVRRMGYTKEEFTPHGFRAMFSTIAYEYANRENGHGYTGEVIEALLAHRETNKVKGAYNRSTYTEAMRGLIQWYANKLDEIKGVSAPEVREWQSR